MVYIKRVFFATIYPSFMYKHWRRILFFTLTFLTATNLHAQHQYDTVRKDGSFGLVLSGGGARGFAHIGVLKVLEEEGLRPDFITGTSMGSIIGGLYAIGYTASQIEELALSTDWEDLFSDSFDRTNQPMIDKLYGDRYVAEFPFGNKAIQLPGSLVAGNKLFLLFSELTAGARSIQDFNKFQIPFACVATDLVTGEPVVIRSGSLVDAMLASMAVPTVFSSVYINGRPLVDGGIVRSVPVSDVREMGADQVLVSLVSQKLLDEEELDNVFNILTQSLTYQIDKSNREQLPLADVIVEPDLGPLQPTDFDLAQVFIQQGEIAARRQLAEIRAIKNQHKPIADRLVQQSVVDRVFINNISIEGLERTSSNIVLEELDLKLPGEYLTSEITSAMYRLYGTGMFDRVSYNHDYVDQIGTLHVQLEERKEQSLRFGLRFDQDNGAVMLFNAHIKNKLSPGSDLNFDLKLGEKLHANARLYKHLGFARSIGFVGNIMYSERERRIAVDGSRVRVPIDVQESRMEVGIGSVYGSRLYTTFGMSAEQSFLPATGSLSNLKRTYTFLSGFGRIWIDTYDRSWYPTKGSSVQIFSSYSRSMGKDDVHTRHLVAWSQRYKVTDELSFFHDLTSGYSTGSNMPEFRHFYAGGLHSPIFLWDGDINFSGLKAGQLSGPNLQALELGFQYQPFPKRYMIGTLGAIRTSAHYEFPLYGGAYEYTARFGVAAETRFGPLELSVMGGTETPVLVALNAGYRF
jgi:NTE family protein